MKAFEFHLDIPAERYLAVYQGSARHAVARCRNGETIQFPALLLKPFLTHTGIHGDFVLTCDDDHRGASLRRTGP
jgi:hypothetical protein